MSLTEIQLRLDTWQAAERTVDGIDRGGIDWVTSNESLGRARDAYLDAVRERAANYGYASGARTAQEDIEHLRQAEVQLAISKPNTPEYLQAARDVVDRSNGIVAQILQDQAHAQETGDAFRRLMGLPTDGRGH
jgi:hypothetical protein